MPGGEEKAPIFGAFGPKLEKGLPVQAFILGSFMSEQITKRLKGRSEEPVLSYLEDLSAKSGEDDIVGKLLDAHRKELVTALTALRTAETLNGENVSEPRTLAQKANEKVDMSEMVVAEIETFLMVIMNTETIQYRNDPTWVF